MRNHRPPGRDRRPLTVIRRNRTMAKREDITAEIVRQLLDFDAATGSLIWRVRPRKMFGSDKAWNTFNTRYAGKIAGCITSAGYSRICINYHRLYCTQVAWLIVNGTWPSGEDRYRKSIKNGRKKNPPPNRKKIMTLEERKKARRASFEKWLAKPGNKEKQISVAKTWRQKPHAKELGRSQALAYAARNREQERPRAERWRKENPEKEVEMKRRYYLNNKEKVQAANSAYRRANPEAYREYSRQYVHAKRAGGGSLSKGRIKAMMNEQNGLCRACGCNLLMSGHHIDHIVPIAKGGLHCDANVQLLCPTCNHRKSAKNFEDFLNELKGEAA